MKSSDLEFKNVYEIVEKNFEVSITVKFNEGHIFLCSENWDPPNSKCYWFVLGGWKGEKSVLRKCAANAIPSYVAYPKGNCSDFKAVVKVSIDCLLLRIRTRSNNFQAQKVRTSFHRKRLETRNPEQIRKKHFVNFS